MHNELHYCAHRRIDSTNTHAIPISMYKFCFCIALCKSWKRRSIDAGRYVLLSNVMLCCYVVTLVFQKWQGTDSFKNSICHISHVNHRKQINLFCICRKSNYWPSSITNKGRDIHVKELAKYVLKLTFQRILIFYDCTFILYHLPIVGLIKVAHTHTHTHTLNQFLGYLHTLMCFKPS